MIYNWGEDDGCFGANHCGVVESISADKTELTTIEFNTANADGGPGSQTNGGSVARRKRTVNPKVKGYIDTGAANPFW